MKITIGNPQKKNKELIDKINNSTGIKKFLSNINNIYELVDIR